MEWLIARLKDLGSPLRWLLEWLLGYMGNELYAHAIEHLVLVFTAVVVAICIAIPLGIVLARCRVRAVNLGVISCVNIIQTVPSLALIAFIMLIFYFIGLGAIGIMPALTALILYAILPILRNTFTSIRQVDPAVIEVATGMGMTRFQILCRIELPLSLSVIMAGIRIATVWTIGCAALTTIIGAGGLGDLIMQGINGMSFKHLIAGTVPAALMALVFDWGLGLLEWWLTPPGLRQNAA